MTAAAALFDRADLDREAVRRRGLREFVARAWPQIDPAPFVGGKHIDAVCEHLAAVQAGAIESLVINQPPGLSKSSVCSVLFPAWVWTQQPTHKFIAASYALDVALRDARRMRTLVAGDWFRARWPAVALPRDASASTAVGVFSNVAGGMRFSTTVRGSVTGFHADTHLIDDPSDPAGAAALSGVELDAVLEWYHGTMATRFVDPRRARRVLVMQRLADRDLAAEMTRLGATVLCLPMEYEPAHPHRYAGDWRTAAGELLCPERFDAAAVARLKRELGPRQYAAQEQQRPVPAGGLLFKEEYFRKAWTELPPGGTFTLSVDAAFKDLKTSSFVVVQCWYAHGPNHYLVDQERGHWGFAATCDQVAAVAARWPKALRKLIEDKANGPAVIEALAGDLSGIEAVTPDGGKEARAAATEPLWAAGNVFLPHPDRAAYPDGRVGAPWVAGFVAEHLAFPLGTHDDQVDAASQYLNRCARNGVEQFRRAWGRVRTEITKGTGT